VAASNYSVNIKLNTKPAIDDLQKLEKRVNRLRRSLNTPLRIESKAQIIEKQRLQAEDRRIRNAFITKRLKTQLNDLEAKGLKLDRVRKDLRQGAFLNQQQRFVAAESINKTVAKELELEQKKLAVVEKSRKAALRGGSTGFKAASGSMVRGEYGPQMLPTKGAGQAAQDIDFLTKQQQKRLGFEVKLRDLEAQGVNTKKLRVKMGQLVDAQNKAELGSIKLLNAQIGKGITKEVSKLNILRKQNKARLEANKLLASESVAQGAFSRLSDRQSRDADGNRTFMNNPFAGFMGRRFGTTRGFDMQSAMISGGFPLLFGQGPIGAAAGGLGGGIGGMFGQMGGFAGGIIATAAVQSLANMTNSMNEFGAALNDPAENLDKLVEKIGKFDREVVETISQLKNAGLTEVAGELASLTMQQQFTGIKAIKNLNNEMSKFQKGAADLGTRLSIIVAGPLTMFFKLLNLIGGSADKASSKLSTSEAVTNQQDTLNKDLERRDFLLKELEKRQKKLANVGFRVDEEVRLNLEIREIEKQLKLNEENIADNERILEIRKLQRDVLLSQGQLLEGQIELERLRAGVTRGTEDEKTVAIKQKQIDMQKVENKILVATANLKSLINNPKATEAEKEAQREKIKNLEREYELVQIIGNERINAADPAISRMDELNRKMRELNDLTKQSIKLSKAIGESFEESFKGVIRGTLTVQDAFRNMLNRIADFFLDTAAQLAATALQRSLLGLFGNLFSFSTVPMNDVQNVVAYAANGGPVGYKNPYIVGERGPELFVPNQSGNIIPNHDLAGIGGGSTNIVVNVDASGTDVEGDDEQGRELGLLISAAVQSEIIQQQRPGGLLA
jgi:hypothetical protein